ncbi:MAG: hypothetical protein AAF628_06335 [Planctomycetota bacterium]
MRSYGLPTRARSIRSALWTAAASVLWCAGTVGAQEPGARAAEREAFAWPWEINFHAISKAMVERDYQVTQVRRIIDRSQPDRLGEWITLRECLTHAAEAGPHSKAFQLEYLGTEGKQLAADELARRTREFDRIAGFLYHFQGFRVFDADLAERNYELAFAGVGQRLDRSVYVVTVTPRHNDRSRWLLELDVRTGYPLYRGEYDEADRLMAEVEVTEFAASVPDDLEPFRERYGVERHPDAGTAAKAIGLDSASVPGTDLLPPGFEMGSSRVLTDPLSGDRRAVVIYSDGVEQLFLRLEPSPSWTIGEGHTFAKQRGPTGEVQGSFVHKGVGYLMVGREETTVREALLKLYAQVASD